MKISEIKEKIKEMRWTPKSEEFWKWHDENVENLTTKPSRGGKKYDRAICIEQYWGKEYAEDGTIKEDKIKELVLLNKGEKINFRGQEIIVFRDKRIQDEEVPIGYKRYSIRHSDDDWGIPRTIEMKVWVNHYGDILAKGDIIFDMHNIKEVENTYTEIRESDEELYIEPFDEEDE